MCSIFILNFTGVYLSLNDNFIANHGYVSISASSTALICHTNRPIDPNDDNSGGDWFAPNGNTVNSATGFVQTRVGMTVQLRRNTVRPSVGIYHCVIRDDTETEQRVYVGLYSRGGGGISIYYDFVCYFIIFKFQALPYPEILHSIWTLLPMKTPLVSPSPVSPLVDRLPLSLGP